MNAMTRGTSTTTCADQPTAIDLFAGAGGLSLGFALAGFRLLQAVEADPDPARTYKHNHPETDLIRADITGLDSAECLERVSLAAGDLECLIGGPPCQGFSESNRRTRSVDNPKNRLSTEFFRFLEAFKPRAFVLENVAGIKTLACGQILGEIVARGEACGYEVAPILLNAIDYGVPQYRRRFFVVGVRAGRPFSPPPPTHGPGLKPFVTVDDAIADLPELAAGDAVDWLPYPSGRSLTPYQKFMRRGNRRKVQGNLVTRNSPLVLERYAEIHPGQNWEAIPVKLMANYQDRSRCHTGIYHRLASGSPSKVIGNFRKNMLIHPCQHRGLSVREAARLQSFPDRYVFLGSIGFQQQQVGNAVPPLLAQAVGNAVRTCLVRELSRGFR
jgi:DNA (cytosine-5)-methyltransferase 1